MSKSRIGSSPLDALVPTSDEPKRKRSKTTTSTEAPKKVKKIRLTVHVPEDVADRAKDATFWTPGLTLAALAEEALSKAVDDLEKKRGEAFPPRTSELRGGRPLK